MRYETMGRNRTQRLNVPQLTGGLNTAVDAALIDDDELADVCNLTPRYGALVTRQAVRAVGDAPLTACEGQYMAVDKVQQQPIEIDGEMCTVVLSAAHTGSPQSIRVLIQTVTLDGVCKRTYTMSTGGAHYTFAIAPCDISACGAPFLMYHHGNAYRPDDATGTMVLVAEDKLYAPLVMINAVSTAYTDGDVCSCKSANGVMYEGYNLLTRRYRAQFTPSVEAGSTTECYIMPTELQHSSSQDNLTMDIVSPECEVTVSMKVGGDAVAFTVGNTRHEAKAFSNGHVRVHPPLQASEISGTVTITAERTGTRVAEVGFSDAGCAQWFGGTQNKHGGTRLFLASGAKLIWSDVNNPLYFPENNYTVVGDSSQRITALEKQSDMLVVFKEREMFYTTYVQGDIDADAVANGTNVDVTASQAYFPLTQLSPSIGCRCRDSIALCRDRLVWMDNDARVYTLTVSGQYSERNVREIGQKLRPWLLENTTAAERKSASAVDHNGKYRVMIGNVMSEFDYNDSGFANVAGYASGERAARNIAWFVHRFDGFPDSATQMIISDGAERAIVISTDNVGEEYKLVRMLYTFADGDKDRYLRFNSVTAPTAEEQPIAVSLTTKSYEFGDFCAFKRLCAVYPMLQAEEAHIAFVTDSAANESAKRYHSRDTSAHLIVPAIKRCRSFAMKLEATGDICLKGLRMEYSTFGTVK